MKIIISIAFLAMGLSLPLRVHSSEPDVRMEWALRALNENLDHLASMFLSGDPKNLDLLISETEFPADHLVSLGEQLLLAVYADPTATILVDFLYSANKSDERPKVFKSVDPRILEIVKRHTRLRKLQEEFNRLLEKDNIELPTNLKQAAQSFLYTVAVTDRLHELSLSDKFDMYGEEKRVVYNKIYGRSPHYLNMALWGYFIEAMESSGGLTEHELDSNFLQLASNGFKNAVLATAGLALHSKGISRDAMFVLNRALEYSELQSIESDFEAKIERELVHTSDEIKSEFDRKLGLLQMREEDYKHEIEHTTPRLGSQLIYMGSLFTLGLILTAFDQQTGVITNFWRESVIYTFLPWATDAWGYWGRNALYGIIGAWQSLQDFVSPVAGPITDIINKLAKMPTNQSHNFLHQAGVANSLLTAALLKSVGIIRGLASELYLFKVKNDLRSIPSKRKLLENNLELAIDMEAERTKERMQETQVVLNRAYAMFGQAQSQCQELLSKSNVDKAQ